MIDLLKRYPLPVTVLAQLFATSLWFSINGVWLSLSAQLGLTETDLGRLTLAVQAGFITGTLTIAVTGLADRFGASRIFAVASLLGALVNGGFVFAAGQPPLDFLLRFATGLCLAGIYPLGMKMVIAWTPKYAGAALAWLVGMLTLGTALPHLMRGATLGMPWELPLLAASMLALVGGGLGLLRPHVGTLCVLDTHALIDWSGAGASGGRGWSDSLAGFCRDRYRWSGLRGRWQAQSQ